MGRLIESLTKKKLDLKQAQNCRNKGKQRQKTVNKDKRSRGLLKSMKSLESSEKV